MKQLIVPILLVLVCNVSYGQAELYWVKRANVRDSIKLRGVQISPFKTVGGQFPDSTGNVPAVSSITSTNGILGGTITSTGTISLDTTVASTKAYRQKGVDSTVSLINAKQNTLTFSSSGTGAATLSGSSLTIPYDTLGRVSGLKTLYRASQDSIALINAINSKGSVTSVATNNGILGGTITSTGTLSLDTTLASTKANVWKVRDSLQSNTVHITGTETISGVKNFSVQPTSIAPTAPTHVTTKIYVDSLGVNVDNVTIRDTTINGIKAIYATPQANSGGTVTSVSVASANGFTGSVTTPTTTPSINIGTSINGLIKGNGSGVALASGGADFAFPNLGYTSITAAGTTQATATAVNGPNSIIQVSTVPAGSGIVLPGAQQYSRVVVSNRGANALLVYPYSTHTINNLASSAPYSLPAGATQVFNGLSQLAWQTSTTFTGGDVNNTDGNAALILPTINANVGTYNSVTVNGKGQVTAASNALTVATQTAAYTIALTDVNKLILMNVATANALTVPPNSSVAFPIGSVVNIAQYGAGQTTITAGAGVTIRSILGKVALSQYSSSTLTKINTDEWLLTGTASLN